MKTVELKKNLYWTGIKDPGLRIFDIIMMTEFGTTYNSYLLKGSEKTALFETAKEKFLDDYIDKVESIVNIEDIDYIIVNHTEPDHAGSAGVLLKKNPSIKLVGTATALKFIREIINMDFNSIVVKHGDTLSLGDKTLRFVVAQNLHWPDSMYTYIFEDKTLISCDSFGCHYAFDGILASEMGSTEDYKKALRYYFDNIMGPFKSFVLKGVEKIKDLDIDMICPGHGPVLDEKPWDVVETYKKWATEKNPNTRKTVVIPYVSAYGYTEIIAEKIEEGIKEAGDISVRSYDLLTADKDVVMNEIYWADGVLFGTPTILGEALKPVWDVLTSMYACVHGGKIASAFGSFGWSGEGVPNVMSRLSQLRMKMYGEGLKIRFRPDEAQLEEAYQYGYDFGLCVKEGKIIEKKPVSNEVKAWKCLVCGEIVYSTEPPESCPVCGVGPEQFVEVPMEEVQFKSEEEEKFLIIGGGIAALTAAEAIRKRNKVASIEIISNEENLCYNRPMLTKGILSEFETINFFTKQADWYEENNVETTLGVNVDAIDLIEKTIKLSDNTVREYDKLIYATGAECNKIPIKGFEKDGVEVVRKLSHANKIRDRLDDVENVIVIGGGILGLETAWELAKAKKRVTVVEVNSSIMSNQLDAKGSDLLRKAAENRNIKIVTGVNIDEITGDKAVTGVKMSDGTKYKGDLVIISAGIKPNVELGIDAGLKGDQWIEVDETMATSDGSVWACGDVAVFEGVSIGIWNRALEMGTVAGANAAGERLTYTPVVPSNSFTGFGTSVFSIGDIGKKKDAHYKILEIIEESKKIYKKLFFDKGKFCGGILMGNVTKTGMMMEAFEKKYNFKDPAILELLED